MKKQYILFAAVVLGLMFPASYVANAQQDNFLLFSSQHQLSSAAVMPSQFGGGNESLWISLPSVHAWAGTDFLKRGDARQIMQGGEIPSELVDRVMNGLDSRNYAYAGAEVSPFAVGYTVRKHGIEMVTLHMSWTEQAAMQTVFGEYLPKVAWYGNKPYAGNNIDLGPIEANGVYQRKIAIGAALPILESDKINLRSGFRLHYNQGMAAAYVRPARAELFTANDGSFIDYDLLVKAQLSGLQDFNPLQSMGRGVGVDFSTSASWINAEGRQFTADAGISDLGFMRFYDQVETHRIRGEQVFQGFQVNDVSNPFDGLSSDTINSFFSSENEPGGSFAMPMSTRMTFRFGYHIAQLDNSGRLFNRHSIYGVYTQGLGDGPMSTVVPGFTAAYVWCFNNILELGSSIGYVNSGLDLGGFASVRAGSFRFGIGSTDFSGLLFNGVHASADASMRMSLAF